MSVSLAFLKKEKDKNASRAVDLLKKKNPQVVKLDFLSLAQTQSHDSRLEKSIKLENMNCD